MICLPLCIVVSWTFFADISKGEISRVKNALKMCIILRNCSALSFTREQRWGPWVLSCGHGPARKLGKQSEQRTKNLLSKLLQEQNFKMHATTVTMFGFYFPRLHHPKSPNCPFMQIELCVPFWQILLTHEPGGGERWIRSGACMRKIFEPTGHENLLHIRTGGRALYPPCMREWKSI